MLIKSKSLLPKLSLAKDEEDDIDELKARLIFLKEIRGSAQFIKSEFAKRVLYKKNYKKKIEKKFRPDDTITLKNILLSLDSLVVRSPIREEIPEVEVYKVKSLKEVIGEVKEKINRFLKINFKELISGSDKKEISVSFLAVLELFRNNEIDLKQDIDFGDIKIEKK
jgi:segregation and condensation protein A